MMLACVLAVLAAPACLLAPAAAQQYNGTPAIGSEEDATLIAILIRATLVALHQANATGNYSVLRELGAPSFRDRNTAADLAENFAPIRRRHINLQAVTVLQPKIEGTPVIDENGLLRVAGSFPTRPVPIRFDMAFQAHERVWRLIGIVVAPITEEEQQGESEPEAAPAIPVPTPRPADFEHSLEHSG
jgi:hypothetical protein